MHAVPSRQPVWPHTNRPCRCRTRCALWPRAGRPAPPAPHHADVVLDEPVGVQHADLAQEGDHLAGPGLAEVDGALVEELAGDVADRGLRGTGRASTWSQLLAGSQCIAGAQSDPCGKGRGHRCLCRWRRWRCLLTSPASRGQPRPQPPCTATARTHTHDADGHLVLLQHLDAGRNLRGSLSVALQGVEQVGPGSWSAGKRGFASAQARSRSSAARRMTCRLQ